MARVVKEHSVRRNEILDVGKRLVYTRGYEQMTIQDILDELHISKGAFYHYFDSKQALLEALTEQMLETSKLLVTPIVENMDWSGPEKLQRFFAVIGQWKTEQKAFLLALIRIWYTDDNAIVRQKVHARGVKEIAPLLTRIIQQGTQEGIWTNSYPEQVSEIVIVLLQGLSDSLSELLLSFEGRDDILVRMETIAAMYNDALERLLGASPGSILIVENEILKGWVVLPREKSAALSEKK